jgi:flavin reductase (DIM6/NTAB) family NADH-FMN oxidoreductase RutF/DnaJ-domain-containing protein 1
MMVRIAALCALAGAAALSVSRAPLEAPLLSSPVYSLATLNGDDSTNMNICTYATPVGIRPQRRWTLSLYRGTRSHANFAARRRGVLQLLREAHAPATHALGGVSAARVGAVDKAAACQALGLEWETCGDWDERVLPGCAAYLRLVAVDGSVDCGDHEVFVCRVAGGFGDAGNHLTTGELRRLGLITAKGAAVEPAAAFAPAPAAAFHQPAFAPPKPRYANARAPEVPATPADPPIRKHSATIREQGEKLRPDTEAPEQPQRTPAPPAVEAEAAAAPPPQRTPAPPAVEAEAAAAPPPEASSDSDVVDVEFAGAQTNGVAAAKLQDLPDDDDDLKGFLLEALKAVAKAKGVDVSACSEKADLVAAIRAAPAAAEPSNSTASGLDLGAGDYDGVLNYYENVAVRRLTKQMVARVLQAANHYDVLGVEVEAGDRDVKVAYRDLALLVHPDKCGADGAAEAFQKINEANEVLGDSAKRATYDAARERPAPDLPKEKSPEGPRKYRIRKTSYDD